MNISLLPGSGQAAGFEAPLDMLSACHDRIERQCATLQRLPAHLAAHGADADAKQAAVNVMHYFDTAGRNHHADEERDLFPALLEAMAGSDAVCLREITQTLTREHRELDAVWQGLRVQLQALSTGDSEAIDSAVVADFIAQHTRHITREEGELLPMAKRLLGEDQLHAIGESMRARRGV